jgi:hypothetical protein
MASTFLRDGPLSPRLLYFLPPPPTFISTLSLSIGSDNALLNDFIAPALGCSVFTSPCSTCPNGKSPSLATNVSFSFGILSHPATTSQSDSSTFLTGNRNYKPNSIPHQVAQPSCL